MATILEQYRKRQNDIREQIAANSLPLDQVLIMQELTTAFVCWRLLRACANPRRLRWTPNLWDSISSL